MNAKAKTKIDVLVEAVWILVRPHFSAQLLDRPAEQEGLQEPKEEDESAECRQDIKLLQQFLKTALVLNCFDEAASRIDGLAAIYPEMRNRIAQLIFEMQNEQDLFNGHDDDDEIDEEEQNILTETGKHRPDTQRLKLKWLIFAKTFNVKKRLLYNAEHANLCFIKGLEFMKVATSDPKAPLLTFEVFLITNCLYGQFAFQLADLVQAYNANQRYLLREIRDIVKTIAIKLEQEQREELQALRLTDMAHDLEEENKFLSKAALQERSKHRRREMLLVPMIASMIQEIE